MREEGRAIDKSYLVLKVSTVVSLERSKCQKEVSRLTVGLWKAEMCRKQCCSGKSRMRREKEVAILQGMGLISKLFFGAASVSERPERWELMSGRR